MDINPDLLYAYEITKKGLHKLNKVNKLFNKTKNKVNRKNKLTKTYQKNKFKKKRYTRKLR